MENSEDEFDEILKPCLARKRALGKSATHVGCARAPDDEGRSSGSGVRIVYINTNHLHFNTEGGGLASGERLQAYQPKVVRAEWLLRARSQHSGIEMACRVVGKCE